MIRQRVLFNEAPMGILTQTDGGQTQFVYDEKWLDDPAATPISLSMPLREAPYKGAKLDNFLWGLLPDNEVVIERWAKNFQVSARNPFGLLKNVGRDVAGALSFVALGDSDEVWSKGSIEDISDRQIGKRLAEIEADPSAWTADSEQGRFSLAGAQGKFALRLDVSTGRWQIPSGSEPTTHIFKPRMQQMAHQEVNEHLTMRLAAKMGLPTAGSHVVDFDGHQAIVVERYDRATVAGRIMRIHQEDFCQALGVNPSKKYQGEGGPGAVELINLLRKRASEPAADIDTFFRALAFNYAVWGTDAHAKNYSLLLSGDQVALAPLYDLNSYLAYAKFGMNEKPVKLAMSIGREFKMESLVKKHWTEFANKAGLDPDYVTGTVRDMVAQAPMAFDEVLEEEEVGLISGSELPSLFRDKLAKRSAAQKGDDVWPLTRQPASWNPEAPETIWVEPHERDGVPVSGHWRKNPVDSKLDGETSFAVRTHNL